MDDAIVRAFLPLAPRFIIFEARHLRAEALTALLEQLAAAGYRTDCIVVPCPRHDVVAEMVVVK